VHSFRKHLSGHSSEQCQHSDVSGSHARHGVEKQNNQQKRYDSQTNEAQSES
jgi:hypothetical protein